MPYVVQTKEQAIQRCKQTVKEFCSAKGIPTPRFGDVGNCHFWFSKVTHNGVVYEFTPYFRYIGDERQYLWDENCPNWRDTYQDTIRVEWSSIKRPHDCPNCECVHELDGQDTIIVP